MRFSAVQEDGYGVGLGQETPCHDVDKSMMAATGDVEPGGNGAEGSSMISNLPLLFASGYPTSLEKITLPELEKFITFMVQCSLGHEIPEVINEPKWWPKEVKFSIPLIRPKKSTEAYMDNLKKLVFRCYTYHRSEYLLRFCSYLAQYPHDKLEYVNNWDSTTSLYLKTTGKLLVTFRNENMEYDKKIESPRRMLLKKSKTNYPNGTKCLRRRSAQKNAPSPAMVEPVMEDIYLCDNCDDEFIGSLKMKEHEKLCYRVERRPITPEYEVMPEIKQDQFMEYFKLASSQPQDTSKEGQAIYNQSDVTQSRTSGRIRGSVNLTRCPTIPFSSPAGIAIGKKSKMMTEVTQQERLERIERHLIAPPLSISLKPKWLTKTYDFERWSVTYKPNRDRTARPAEYVHQYKFGKYNGKSVLDIRSQLLYIACKPIYVVLTRQTDEELEELKRDPSRYKSPERKVPRIRPRSPSIEPIDDSDSGEKANPIVIDLIDDDEPPISTPRKLPTFPSFPSFSTTTTPPTATVTPMPIPASRLLSKSTGNIDDTIKKTPIKRSRSSGVGAIDKSILVVDLCSSDDDDNDDDDVQEEPVEEIGYVVYTANKSHDPLQKRTTAPEMRVEPSSFLRGSLLSPSKHYPRSACVYPTSSTGNWLASYRNDGNSRSTNFLTHAAGLYKTNSP